MTSICSNSISQFEYVDACKDQKTRGQCTSQMFGINMEERVRRPCYETCSRLMLWNVVKAHGPFR